MNEICRNINALGIGTTLEVEKVKKKWFDMKPTAKKAVAKYKIDLAKQVEVVMQLQRRRSSNLKLLVSLG